MLIALNVAKNPQNSLVWESMRDDTYLLSLYVYHLYLYLPSGKPLTPWIPYHQRALYTLNIPTPFCLARV